MVKDTNWIKKTVSEPTEQQISSGMAIANVGVFPDSSIPPVRELHTYGLCRVT